MCENCIHIDCEFRQLEDIDKKYLATFIQRENFPLKVAYQDNQILLCCTKKTPIGG
jgi:hypothetical protein